MFDTIRITVKIEALAEPQSRKEIEKRLTAERGWTSRTQVVPIEARGGGGRQVNKTIYKSVLSDDPAHQPKKGRGGHKGLSLCRLMVDPYSNTLTIESSLPKVAYGTNALVLYDATDALARLHQIAQDEIGIELPDLLSAQVYRIDYSTLFALGSQAQVRDTIRALATVEVSGRQTSHIHGAAGDTVAFFGKKTKVTLYDKHAEALLSQPWAAAEAEGKLRLEVVMRRRQLKSLSGSKRPTLREMLTADYGIHALHREMEHMGLRGMKIETPEQMVETLRHAHGDEVAQRLYGFVSMLVDLGKAKTRELVSRRSYYRYMKQLREAGVAPIRSSEELAGISLALSSSGDQLDERERVNLLWAMGGSGASTGSKERTFEDAARRWNELVDDSLALTSVEARSKLPKEQREELRAIAQRYTAMERGEDEVEMSPEEIWLDSDVFDLGTNTEALDVLRERGETVVFQHPIAWRMDLGDQGLSPEEIAEAAVSEAVTRAEKEAA